MSTECGVHGHIEKMWSIRRLHSSLTKGGQTYIDRELKYGAHNYHSLPVVLSRGQGVYLYDTAGKQYLDFLAAYSAVNQGHCHPKIVQTLVEQSQKLTLCCRAFYSEYLAEAVEFLHDTFGYEKAIMMNSGVEAVETSVKIARKWGYEVKGVAKDQATVLFPTSNFWGRSIAACGASDDPDRFRNFGPFGGMNFNLIPYNNAKALEAELQSNPNIVAFVLEPIQGEAGVLIPDEGYLSEVRRLCTQYNVLMIVDEIQTGLGRTGKMLTVDWENVKPDIVTLAKSLSGGMMPISVALADSKVMDVLSPNTHGSTFGGSPIACKVLKTALTVTLEERLAENSEVQGQYLRSQLQSMSGDVIVAVRGKGLMSAIDIAPGKSAWSICMKLGELGLLAKPTHDRTIRLTPPLIITRPQVDAGLELISKAIKQF